MINKILDWMTPPRCLIACLICLSINLLMGVFHKPKTVIQTVEKIKTVDKVVTQVKVSYVDRYIDIKEPNGKVIKEHIIEHTSAGTSANSSTLLYGKDKTITEEGSSKKNWSVDLSYKSSYSELYSPILEYDKLGMKVGYRLFSGLWVTYGNNIKLNDPNIGVRIEL